MTTRPRRTDRASRWIAVRPEILYDAFVDPAQLLLWLPPRGARGRLDAFEPRPGGAFRMTLTFDDSGTSHGKTSDTTDAVSGRFVELVPNRRIALAIDFISDDQAFAGTMTMTWQFVPERDGTRVDITAVNVPPGISAADHELGMASSLENLAALVAGRAG